MRRITFIAALIASVLVIGYAGWLSHLGTTKPVNGTGNGDGTSQTNDPNGHQGGKPGEAPKD